MSAQLRGVTISGVCDSNSLFILEILENDRKLNDHCTKPF